MIAAAWLGTAALVGLTANPIARHLHHRRAKLANHTRECREYGDALYVSAPRIPTVRPDVDANIEAYESMPSWMLR